MKIIALAAVAVSLSACAGLPAIHVGVDPSDSAVSVPLIDDASVMAGTVEYLPVEPKPWVEQNERVTPKPRSAQ